ncbi:type II secretion system protein J [Planctomycetota bacterium]
MMYKTLPTLPRGTTLPETLVAVSITVAMLAVSGMIFNSAITASGKAAANTEIMNHKRTLTRQLEADLSGLHPDMPMVIVFEENIVDLDKDLIRESLVRRDRIVFYANGDFQTNNFNDAGSTISGNVARILYSQSQETFYVENDFPAPLRQILTRRYKIKISTKNPIINRWINCPFTNADEYDYIPVDLSFYPLAIWKGMSAADYQNTLLRDDLPATIGSIIRRPSLGGVINNQFGPDGLQRMYLLPDVTDFKIQFWFFDSARGQWRWYPDQYDMSEVDGNYTMKPNNIKFAYAWNTPATGVFLIDDNSGFDWPCWFYMPGNRPRALKFTFTLYDQKRTRFPLGQTFSYIVQLPQ